MDTPNVIAGDADNASTLAPSEKKVRDAKGRTIVVRPLNSLDTYRLLKITKAGGTEGFFGMAVLAVSARSIDGTSVYANTDREVEATIQWLGNHGLAAVADALVELHKEEEGAGDDAPKT